ncbi:MAG: hypothetical protein C4321_06190, partial [Chloroflexota bacterium]
MRRPSLPTAPTGLKGAVPERILALGTAATLPSYFPRTLGPQERAGDEERFGAIVAASSVLRGASGEGEAPVSARASERPQRLLRVPDERLDRCPARSPRRSGLFLPTPRAPGERDAWIRARRAARNMLDPWQPYAFLVETEAEAPDRPVEVATLFLTNRECPFRCLMCDLWRNALVETVPTGAIA